jgi:hypothetical protein
MNPTALLKKFAFTDLTAEEEAELIRELSRAYQIDEAAATDGDVHRIAEKVRTLLDEGSKPKGA